jgi:hypothetical protein
VRVRRYIVGTKADLLEEGVPRGVEASEVADYARQINAHVFDSLFPPSPPSLSLLPARGGYMAKYMTGGGLGGGERRFETSSKKGYSVEDLFDTIVYDFVKRGAAGYAPPRHTPPTRFSGPSKER